LGLSTLIGLALLGCAAVAIAASVGGGPHTPALPPARPLGEEGRWHVVFDDEFRGSALDTSKWSTGWFGSGITGAVKANEPECNDPRQVVESGDELQLTLVAKHEYCNGSEHSYASGIVTTIGKFAFTYGFVEVRARLPASYGRVADWPGIWTDGLGVWPTTGELDVVEGIGGQACWHFHDPAGDPGSCTTTDYAGSWHTYGADWEPGSVTFYYDGKRVATLTRGITGAPMYLILGLGSAPGLPVIAPARLQVGYVRVWQH
jgi:beta-glucanase (GH16 family)